MKLLQINTTINSGSTGRITEDIGKVAQSMGHDSYIAYGRGNQPSSSKLIRIGSGFDVYWHGIQTLLSDRHGCGSANATEELLQQLDIIKPDVIGLHNLHGYYINIKLLFDYLKSTNIPVLWTLFDCWAFTGHCTYFDDIQCEKWKTHCHQCPKYRNYPKAFIDNSFRNYKDKKHLFTGVKNLEIMVHSRWLANQVNQSFLKNYPIHVSPSGIDLSVFTPIKSSIKEVNQLKNKKVVLGVASVWSERKGLADFIQLSKMLDSDHKIVLIGIRKKQKRLLTSNILTIERTENTNELAKWYSLADVFVNPTYQDNFPTTNLEALACGTPVVTYNTGGSPEALDNNTGLVVEKGDIHGLYKAVENITRKGKEYYTDKCRKRAVKYFNKDDRFKDYLKIYESLL